MYNARKCFESGCVATVISLKWFRGQVEWFCAGTVQRDCQDEIHVDITVFIEYTNLLLDINTGYIILAVHCWGRGTSSVALKESKNFDTRILYTKVQRTKRRRGKGRRNKGSSPSTVVTLRSTDCLADGYTCFGGNCGGFHSITFWSEFLKTVSQLFFSQLRRGI
jgi:hypothetical protein